MSLFHRRRTDSVPPETKGSAPRRPHAGLLRRERHDLLRARDAKLRDLGGLMVEMYRRGGFRDDLVQERCAQLVGIDTRLVEIDDLLHGRGPTRSCTCGASILYGAHFCPNCGRVVGAVTGPGSSDDTVISRPPHEEA
jgi:hypothetical protein